MYGIPPQEKTKEINLMNGKKVATLNAEFRKTRQPRKERHTDDYGSVITINNWRRFKRSKQRKAA